MHAINTHTTQRGRRKIKDETPHAGILTSTMWLRRAASVAALLFCAAYALFRILPPESDVVVYHRLPHERANAVENNVPPEPSAVPARHRPAAVPPPKASSLATIAEVGVDVTTRRRRVPRHSASHDAQAVRAEVAPTNTKPAVVRAACAGLQAHLLRSCLAWYASRARATDGARRGGGAAKPCAPADCHGRGVCDLQSGVCACEAGFNGTGCEGVNVRVCNGKTDSLWHASHCAGECDERRGFCWCPGKVGRRTMADTCQVKHMPLAAFAALTLKPDPAWVLFAPNGTQLYDPGFKAMPRPARGAAQRRYGDAFDAYASQLEADPARRARVIHDFWFGDDSGGDGAAEAATAAAAADEEAGGRLEVVINEYGVPHARRAAGQPHQPVHQPPTAVAAPPVAFPPHMSATVSIKSWRHGPHTGAAGSRAAGARAAARRAAAAAAGIAAGTAAAARRSSRGARRRMRRRRRTVARACTMGCTAICARAVTRLTASTNARVTGRATPSAASATAIAATMASTAR